MRLQTWEKESSLYIENETGEAEEITHSVIGHL